MSSLTVLVPALARPANVKRLCDSLDLSVANERRQGWTIKLLFICCRDDKEEIVAVHAEGLEPLLCTVSSERHQYPKKINAGARTTSSDWLFLGADDLDFHWGWLREAINTHIRTGHLVIGTQDMGNQLVRTGRHSTHTLVHRDYLALGTIDERGKLLHEGYDHNSCDVEFIETAIHRDQFTFASESVVEHLHPLWHRGKVQRDAVYNKGLQRATMDRMLLNRRRHLWGAGKDPQVRRTTSAAPRRVLAVPRNTPRWPKR